MTGHRSSAYLVASFRPSFINPRATFVCPRRFQKSSQKISNNNVTLRYVTLRYVTLRYATLRYAKTAQSSKKERIDAINVLSYVWNGRTFPIHVHGLMGWSSISDILAISLTCNCWVTMDGSGEGPDGLLVTPCHCICAAYTTW